MASEKDEAVISVKSEIARVAGGLRYTRITATRCIKIRDGDFFTGLTAEIEGEPGAEVTEKAPHEVADYNGLMKDVRLAAMLVGMETDLACHRQCLSGNGMTADDFERSEKIIRRNYGVLLKRVAGDNTE